MIARHRVFAGLAAVSLVGAVAAVLTVTRPQAPAAPTRITEVRPEPGEQAHARDVEHHYAPGSPAAMAERFLRARLRYHYDDAAALATGAERARCERNVELYRQMTPEVREDVRAAQVFADATEFDLERAVVDDLAPGPGNVARKEVRGVIYAHGLTPDGHPVENRRAQTLVMHLLDGAWRVAEWSPGPSDGGIVVH